MSRTHQRSSRHAGQRDDRRPAQHRSWSNRIRRNRYAGLAGALAGFLGFATLVGTAFGATTAAPAAAPAAPAVPNANCSLTVPANPLSAKGLATPYLLTATDAAAGPCNEANVNQSAFVQATVVDPATGALSVYNPLVIDKGTKPAAAPVLPVLPAGAVVGIWFGFNGNNLTLRSQRNSLADGRCVNGGNGSIFGQFAYCNAGKFFGAANAAQAAGMLTVPAPGTGKDGKTCLTTRDFGLVDQDQSDNVTTDYLANANGQIAQKTAANTAAMAGSVSLANGSDNLLLTAFVDPALGCTAFTAPDLANPGQQATSLGLDEIQAAKFQAAPIALVPLNDPMAQVNAKANRTKTNLYRTGVGQARLGAADNGDPLAYCKSLSTVGAQRIKLDQQLFAAAPSPQAGQNLFDFLMARFTASLTNLNCPVAAAPGAGASASASASATASASASASASAVVTPTMTASKPAASASASAVTSAPATMAGSATPTAPAKTTQPSPVVGSATAVAAPMGSSAPASMVAAMSPAPVTSAPGTLAPVSLAPVSPAPMTPAPATSAPGTAPAIGIPVSIPSRPGTVVPAHDVVPQPVPVGTVLGNGTSKPAAMATGATMVRSAVPTATAATGVLAKTGASSSTLPIIGLAVSLMLLGLSAFLLVGQRRSR